MLQTEQLEHLKISDFSLVLGCMPAHCELFVGDVADKVSQSEPVNPNMDEGGRNMPTPKNSMSIYGQTVYFMGTFT